MEHEAKAAFRQCLQSISLDLEMRQARMRTLEMNRSRGSPVEGCKTPGASSDDEDELHGRVMDSRLYMLATQGNVDGFTLVLGVISSEKKLQLSEILCQVSPQTNTCLHIAASFGHHQLAEYIVGKCPQIIMKRNSKGDTALHIAARKNDSFFVKAIMDSFQLINSESWSTKKDEASFLRIVNKEGDSVLHEALINHCREVAKVFIEADPQMAYYPNKEGKSPLFLAAEAGYMDVVKIIEKSAVEDHMKYRDLESKPAVHGAILSRNLEMLKEILAMEPFHQTDKEGRTPIHCAASIGYLEGVSWLLNHSDFDRYTRDSNGFCPIHIASSRGHVDIVKELLQFSFDSRELLSQHGENILHVAAKYGRDNVVKFVLKEEGLEMLINEKDNDGNTPLHLATFYGHPKVVSYLTWDKRVNLNLVNNAGETAFDFALPSVGHAPSFYERLIWIALKSSGAQAAQSSKELLPIKELSGESESAADMESYKERVNTLLLVSTLVATMAFAAGFTMPGGYSESEPDAGMAIMVTKDMFHVFLICNTIAMYTSILVTITLIWAQLGDLNLVLTALKLALPLLGLALTAMSLAFMAGVYLVVSNLRWLANFVFITGIISLVTLLALFVPLFLLSSSTNRILRYISYYPFRVMILASKSPKIKLED